MDWSLAATFGLAAVGGAALSWVAGGAIAEPVAGGVVRWGGLVVSGLAGLLAVMWSVSWLSTARVRSRAADRREGGA